MAEPRTHLSVLLPDRLNAKLNAYARAMHLTRTSATIVLLGDALEDAQLTTGHQTAINPAPEADQ